MEILVDIIYSILLMVWGFFLIKYRRNVKSWTGNFMWAERYIWSGWTYLVLILTWLFMIFLGVLYPFWWLELLFGETATNDTIQMPE